MKYIPHEYQAFGTNHVIENLYSGLFFQMGLGKTVSTLTAIDILLYEMFEANKVLIIAPLRVANETWPDEIEKWDHLRHLTYSRVIGSEKKRKEALKAKADIYLINRENVAWLVGLYGRGFPFDTVVIDEISSFKNPKSERFRALKAIRPYINRVVGLTGTPRPSTAIDLWSQLYLLDMGERLGKTISGYREKYFKPGLSNGHVVYNYEQLPGAEEEIYKKISDICISMKTEDYLQLPDRIDRFVNIHMPAKIQEQYQEFERKEVLKLMDCEIAAVNAAALTNKLLQFSNGAIYDEDRNAKEVHDLKLKALEEIVDTANENILVFYAYKHDRDRILKHLKKYKPQELKTAEDSKDWNAGKVKLMLAHPASAGHGLNLQAGGNVIVWFGLTWSLELYEQANARLHRQGQLNNVIIHHLIVKGTMDEDVMAALERKAKGQNALMEAVKARIQKWSVQSA